MSSPGDYLPKPPSKARVLALLETLRLPPPVSIRTLSATAAYHTVLLLAYPHMNDLILRVSGSHLPHIKTQNEVAIMAWVARNTTIPMPLVVHADHTVSNPLEAEYTILTRVPGQSLSDVWLTLPAEEQKAVLDGLADYLLQLHAVPWAHIGGLVLNADRKPQPGPAVDEFFWQTQDLGLWPAGENVVSLNTLGPFESYVDYCTARIGGYARLCELHPSLEFMRPLLPALGRLAAVLRDPANAAELNHVNLRLAHRDLHFPNIIYDTVSRRITAILDWEFSGIVPFTKWDPARAFLWDGRDDEGNIPRKRALVETFRKRCAERGVPDVLKDAEYVSERQDAMQGVVDYLRAIVEVCPRGEKLEAARGWRDAMVRFMEVFVEVPEAIAASTG